MFTHRKYNRSAEDIKGSYTSLIRSAEGVFWREYAALQRRTRDALGVKWGKPFSQVIDWLRI